MQRVDYLGNWAARTRAQYGLKADMLVSGSRGGPEPVRGLPPIAPSRVSESSAGTYSWSGSFTFVASDKDSKARNWLLLEPLTDGFLISQAQDTARTSQR